MNLVNEIYHKITFENGFTYYIRSIPGFSGRVSMALIIKAGSMFESANERGVAHLLEHVQMDFHKTAMHPNIEFRAKAHTDFHETTFHLDCNNDFKTIGKCLEILGRIYKGKYLREEAFIGAKEDVLCEIIRDESLNAKNRQLFSILLNGSSYLNSMAISDIESVNRLTYDDVTTFYDKWYVPCLSAVSLVGDFGNAKELRKYIRNIFGEIHNKKPPKITVNVNIPAYDTETKKIFVDCSCKCGMEVYFKATRKGFPYSDSALEEIEENIVFNIISKQCGMLLADNLQQDFDVAYEKVFFDSTYFFYLIQVKYEKIDQGFSALMRDSLESFFKCIRNYINTETISNALIELNKDAGIHDEVYESIEAQDLINECIYDYTGIKQLIPYNHKYMLFKKHLEVIAPATVLSYIEYWMTGTDRVFIEKLQPYFR